MSIPNRLRVVGEKVAAIDGTAKVTGTATFTFDRKLPGMLHIKLLRSPHPHARIRNIDTKAAVAVKGVHAVATARDFEGMQPIYGVRIKDQPVLAIDKVRFRGD